MRPKEAGSIRSEGFGTIGVSKVTKEKLKALAGDMPMSEFLKAIADQGKQANILPGMGKSVSQNTISNLNTKMNDLNYAVNKICQFLGLSPEMANSINKGFPAHDTRAEFEEAMLLADKALDILKEKAEAVKQYTLLDEVKKVNEA